ncbi:glycosyltransferase family 2 protein [Enterobacteriaceae bacterium H4N4]|uniref:Glycosyltransferase family 2 protein n=1 Tax=Silvania confinis TaxID=2926470 RepID=A0A9J6QE45_9ENTR|nr:glycosyltransferase family 2 protein [Silvania confinis]MCU6670152.1 glycosyltransferase family 2 protein [Silvania confinis]
MSNGVTAIVITYNPDKNKILNCIMSLIKQVDNVLVIDNGSTDCDVLNEIAEPNVDIVLLNDNKGIAFAQNHGAEIALQNPQLNYLFFSDQDTIFPENSVGTLITHYEKHNLESGNKIGCCSPFFKDHRTGHIHPSVTLDTFTSRKVIATSDSDDLFPSHVIASGMLISKHAWEAVGPFREDLFIDWVDTEWCWRAHSKGYLVVQTPSVMISHELGYGQKNFAGRNVTIHNSFRNYYKIRNALYLMVYSNYSFKYRYHLFFHSAKNIVFEIIYSKHKLKSVGVVWKAIADAFQKKMNKGN